jgi:hypothetical protein
MLIYIILMNKKLQSSDIAKIHLLVIRVVLIIDMFNAT